MDLINWLMEGDVSIQYQAQRDLEGKDDKKIQARIEREGWGKLLLSKRKADGHWGLGFYQPKWTSSHYTLLELRNLCINPDQEAIKNSIEKIAHEEKGIDGGINPSGTVNQSDVCINGMFLNYASYFKIDESLLVSVVDFMLSQIMPDGGFNCRLNRSGARHSSMHTTISAIEGITEYRKNAYNYRLEELLEAEKTSREFLLQHRLYKSDRTGEVIDERFLKMPYPCRWRYDFLRALDYFQLSGAEFDARLMPAIDWLLCKRIKDKKWKVNAKHPGKSHFEMEKAGTASRWNTLRALRVLKFYGIKN